MATPIKAHRGSGPDDNAPHILVVDDDARIRDLLARYLHDHGFRVTTAVDAASARATMRSLSFDLLILDVMMPQESGIDFARSMRTESQLPILMLTARAEPEQRIEGLETGVDDYLTKPFDPRELLLTERERELLRYFAQRPGTPISRHELAKDADSGGERAVDVQINRLRRKIEHDSANPVYLQTVRGKGYILYCE